MHSPTHALAHSRIHPPTHYLLSHMACNAVIKSITLDDPGIPEVGVGVRVRLRVSVRDHPGLRARLRLRVSVRDHPGIPEVGFRLGLRVWVRDCPGIPEVGFRLRLRVWVRVSLRDSRGRV